MPEPDSATATEQDKKEVEQPKKPELDPHLPLSSQMHKLEHLADKGKPEGEGDEDDEGKKKPDEEDEKDSKQKGEEDQDDDDATTDDEDDDLEDDDDELKATPPQGDMGKYIFEKLPVIHAFGHIPGGKDKVFQVKREEDLPADFEFSTNAGLRKFLVQVNNSELYARQLAQQYETDQRNAQIKKMNEQTALDVERDLKELQRQELIPKFKYKETDSRFNDDPAVKLANAIYKIFDDTNKAYAAKGMGYRISYADAADKYFVAEARKPKSPEKQKAEQIQQERLKAVGKQGAPQGGDEGKKRVKLPPNATLRDIERLANQGAI